MKLQSFGTENIATEELIELRSPSDQRIVIGTMPVCSESQLTSVIVQAKEVQTQWAKVSISERMDAIQQLIPYIEKNTAEIAQLLKLEQGMLETVTTREVKESLGQIQVTLSVASKELKTLEYLDQDFQATVRKVPYGIVGAIVPWNAPISLATTKVIPALLAGNAVVIKPSQRAPIGVTYFLNLFRKFLPHGLVNVLHGLDRLGESIINHPDIGKVSFTGSTETGKRVARSAAYHLKSVQLELGGNDAAIVLQDADIDGVASKIIDSAFRRSGQFCYATKRVYVHASVEDQFFEALLKYTNKLNIGPPSDERATFGPVIDRAAKDRLENLISDVSRSNALVQQCGTILDSADFVNGCYVRPTLVRHIERSHPLVIEEQFGPVLPLLSYRSIDEVIKEINSQKYGLSGSVWGSDIEKLNAIAERINAGRIFVNAARAMGDFSGHLPAGGHRHSGLGWEKSVFGLREYYQYQTLNGPRI